MNAIKAAPSEKKKVEDKGFFVQLPCYLIDEYHDKLTPIAEIAFLRFLRIFSNKGNAEYVGSYRALSKKLDISHTSAIRVTDQWQEAGIAEKKEDENTDMLTISVSLAPIWQKNIEYSKQLKGCPNLGTATDELSQIVTGQTGTNGSVVTNIDTAVTICDNLVTFCSTFEHKTDPRYIEITKILSTLVPPTFEQEQHICGCANATPHLQLVEIDPLSEDMPEAQPKITTINQADSSYSQGFQEVTQQTLFTPGDGYRQNEDKPAQEQPSKDNKTKRTRRSQPKIELTPEQKEHCRRWYAHFEKVHGEPFETKEVKINVAKYIKMLVLKYDETTIMRIFKHLSEKDFKWSKPSYKFKITPYVVYTEAPSVLQQLGNLTEKPKSELVDFTDWTDDEWDHYQRTGNKPARAMRA